MGPSTIVVTFQYSNFPTSMIMGERATGNGETFNPLVFTLFRFDSTSCGVLGFRHKPSANPWCFMLMNMGEIRSGNRTESRFDRGEKTGEVSAF